MKLIQTTDGSKTILLDNGETYHSIHGAIQESQHIFIKAGLHVLEKCSKITIFELGFGTGLNALLTAWQLPPQSKVSYISIDPLMLEKSLWETLNYPEKVAQIPPSITLENPTKSPESHAKDLFQKIHESPCHQWVPIHDRFELYKIQASFESFQIQSVIDHPVQLIYYDPFANATPLWSESCLAKCRDMAETGSLLLSYCVKGSVKRSLRSLGFSVERLPGPPGKRHILRASFGLGF